MRLFSYENRFTFENLLLEQPLDVRGLVHVLAVLLPHLAELKADVAELKTKTDRLVNDVGDLKGSNLEVEVCGV